jgi:hypothetical protein
MLVVGIVQGDSRVDEKAYRTAASDARIRLRPRPRASMPSGAAGGRMLRPLLARLKKSAAAKREEGSPTPGLSPLDRDS